MKKIVVLISLLLVVISCKKECPQPPDPPSLNESFYMYVNGKYWEPKVHSFITSKYVSDFPGISYYSSDSILIISARNMETDENIEFCAKIFQVGNYNLKKDYRELFNISPDNDTLLAQFKTRFDKEQGYQSMYFLEDIINSQILITKFDTSKSEISGKFFMVLLNSLNDTLFINNGFFNYKYAKMK